jgi:hypothetical protein
MGSEIGDAVSGRFHLFSLNAHTLHKIIPQSLSLLLAATIFPLRNLGLRDW